MLSIIKTIKAMPSTRVATYFCTGSVASVLKTSGVVESVEIEGVIASRSPQF